MKRAAALLLVASLAAAVGCKSAPAWLQNGMRAPELSGKTVDGTPVALSQERGKVVAVIFFADWCPHCRGLYETERELAKRLGTGPFAMIGVDADDTRPEIAAAIRRERVTWPIIDDSSGRNSNAWGVTGLPTTYVIDADGVIRVFDATGSSLLSAVDELLAKTPKR